MDEGTMRRMAAALVAVRGRTRYLHEHFGKLESQWKHDGTRVTAADLAISRTLFEELSARFPEDQYFSEETEPGGAPVPVTSRYVWVLDPIDGTNNYALGIPFCAISLALLQDGVPVCGFIYDLGLRVLFHGGPGIGLFADGAPIERRPETAADSRVLALHSPVSTRHLPLIERILTGYKLRGFGSGSLHLAYVALGRIDVCVDLTVRVWDIAAASAFCAVTGVEIHYFDTPPFPLRQFDLQMPPVRYAAGGSADCAVLLPKLREAGILAGPER